MARIFSRVACLAVMGLLAACSPLARLPAVPQADVDKATVLGIVNERFMFDQVERMEQEGRDSLDREAAYLASIGHRGPWPPAYFLAISGGGQDGAFGAGLLVGWAEHGDRPVFKLVTGISTGALAAPFAFVGGEYEHVLAEMYTTVDQQSIFVPRPFFAVLTDDGMADTTPLFRLISKYVDERLLERIGQEYDKGRLLLIATTDLDAAQPVIWNIGAIARSGNPRALNTVRHILLASASIPGAFPPVLFNVSVAGKPYQELHVDGGAVAQAFLYPSTLSSRSLSPATQSHVHIAYIIRNGKLDAPWDQTERQTLPIATRAIATLIASNGVGDLYHMYVTAHRDDVDYNVAYVENDFTDTSPDLFDRAYMNRLYAYGRAKGRAGYTWRKTPPRLAE